MTMQTPFRKNSYLDCSQELWLWERDIESWALKEGLVADQALSGKNEVFLKDKTNYNVYFYFVLQRCHHQIVRATKSLRPAKPEEAYGSHELPSPSGVGSALGF